MRGLAKFGVFAASLLMAGCCMFAKQDAHAPVVAGNAYPATVVPSIKVRLSDISIKPKGDSLVIAGVLHPRSFMHQETGYVDIRIVDAQGNLVRQLKAVPDTPVFREKGQPLPRFSISTRADLPKGARFHIQPHK